MPSSDPSRLSHTAPVAARRRALALLKEQHVALVAAFEPVDELPPPERRSRIEDAIARLEAHARFERDVLDPVMRPVAGERVEEGEVEHASMAALVHQVRAGGPDDPKSLARFKVLGEFLRHHLREEELGLFEALPPGAPAWLDILKQLESAPTPAPAPRARKRPPRAA